MEGILLIDFGSTYTKVTAVDIDNESIMGTAKALTTVETDISEGLENALKILQSKTGKVEYNIKLACSSAAGGLRMTASGLVPELTSKAAKMAALSAGAKVIKVYSYELTLEDAEEIYSTKPDLFLLTGGTDGGNKKVLLHNAKVLAGIDLDFPVVMAGNKSVGLEVAGIIFESGKEVTVCSNVMPEFNELNFDPARNAIRNIFLRRIIKAKGLTRIQSLVEGIIMPTPKAVLNAAQYLSAGTKKEKGIGDILIVDVGGATTDVHSLSKGEPSIKGAILKGLREPFAKRTVEGDLGVRYSAPSLVEAVGVETVSEKAKMDTSRLEKYIELIKNPAQLLPDKNQDIKDIDYALACIAVKIAVKRHAGKIESRWTPAGVTFLQTGKDLTTISKIIGTGGPVINSKNAAGVLKEAVFDNGEPMCLKPKEPEFLLDEKYILYAMGLLCEFYPDTAVRIMKKNLKSIV